MIDLIDVAATRLKEMGYTPSKKRLDTVKEGVVIRRVPSAVTNRYFNRDSVMGYIFQIIVKRESEAQAIEECCDIADRLINKDLASQNGSYKLIKCEVYTEPQELVLTTGGFYTWTVRFRCEILRKEQ